jgi:hypothetical protein
LVNFLKNKHVTVPLKKKIIVHNKTMVLMQARRLVYKLIPPGCQYKQAFPACLALFNHAIHGIYDFFKGGP